MTAEAPVVRIHYRRPPDRETVFEQRVLHDGSDGVVTFLGETPLDQPMRVDGRTVLEDGSPAIWFTFPGAWHDIGRFHRADGTFTGVYANILTPVHFVDEHKWETTDLFLDVWLGAGGEARIMDEDELRAAVARGWVDEPTAERARTEAARILERAERHLWPPSLVEAWTLERVWSHEDTTR